MTITEHIKIHWREIIACLSGILIGGFITLTLFVDHQPANPYDTAYHTHADFVIYLRGERIDLAKAEYMTTNQQSLHSDVHLHDDVGDVVHFHAPEVTFSEFLSSLGYTLTNDCFISRDGEQFCTSDGKVLQLYVNDMLYSEDISAYVPQDLDRMLVYYGDPSSPTIADYLDEVTDESCIYSGSCPGRGVAPPESCGLTCEL